MSTRYIYNRSNKERPLPNNPIIPQSFILHLLSSVIRHPSSVLHHHALSVLVQLYATLRCWYTKSRIRLLQVPSMYFYSFHLNLNLNLNMNSFTNSFVCLFVSFRFMSFDMQYWTWSCCCLHPYEKVHLSSTSTSSHHSHSNSLLFIFACVFVCVFVLIFPFEHITCNLHFQNNIVLHFKCLFYILTSVSFCTCTCTSSYKDRIKCFSWRMNKVNIKMNEWILFSF